MTTFRIGDKVTVKAVVVSDLLDFDGTAKIKVAVEPYHDIFVPASEIEMVRPDFRKGDMVDWTVGTTIFRGEVIAIAEDHLWVRMGGGEFATVFVSDATRVDDVASADEAEAAL